MKNISCVYSVETAHDGQKVCPKYVECFHQNKFEKQSIQLAFIIRKKSVSGKSDFHTANIGSYLKKDESDSHIKLENGNVCTLQEAVEQMWVIKRHFPCSSSKTLPVKNDIFQTLIVAMISQEFSKKYGFKYSIQQKGSGYAAPRLRPSDVTVT